MSVKSEYHMRLFELAKGAQWLSDDEIRYAIDECKAWGLLHLVHNFVAEMNHRENMLGLHTLDDMIENMKKRRSRQ